MTVKEICDKLATFDDENRVKYAGGLCKALSPVSMSTLQQFQRDWDGNKSPAEFFAAQAEEIKKCVELEIGTLGDTVRQLTGLEPLKWETEIAA